jgi:hypothetical protein
MTDAGIKGKVYNGDVYGIYLRMNRFLEELWKSASSSVPYMSKADQTRLEKYLDSIDAYVAWVQAQPELDLPETAPKEYALTPKCPWTRVESDDIDDILRQFDDSIEELINSQSARQPCKLITYDEQRTTAYVEKMRRFLLDYIQKVQPLDIPESSPRDVPAGTGKGGV